MQTSVLGLSTISQLLSGGLPRKHQGTVLGQRAKGEFVDGANNIKISLYKLTIF